MGVDRYSFCPQVWTGRPARGGGGGDHQVRAPVTGLGRAVSVS